jgi:hypothetical protein
MNFNFSNEFMFCGNHLDRLNIKPVIIYTSDFGQSAIGYLMVTEQLFLPTKI